MRVLTTAAVTGAVAAALVLTGCSPAKDSAADTAGTTAPSPAASRPAGPTPAPRTGGRTVTYRLDGTAGSTDLAYATKSTIKKEKGAPLPWTKTLPMARGDRVMLSVSALSTGGGTLRCEIDVDGVKVKEDSGKDLDIVDCEYTLKPATG
jgi:hypothetical protein